MNDIIKYGLFYQQFDGSILVLQHVINEECDIISNLISKFTAQEWQNQGGE